MSIIIVMD